MRTPNSECVICAKPLYRRPYEMQKVRYVACMKHRAEAQALAGVTDAQKASLSLGRVKGDNHRTGYRHKESSKALISEANKTYWALHPNEAKARGAKNRGENHYAWKGGASSLNIAIRQLQEHRDWSDAVKARDGACSVCGASENLEAHHLTELSVLVREYNVTDTNAARVCAALWDLANGVTLCGEHHYAVHGRNYSHVLSHSDLTARTRTCMECSSSFLVRPSEIANGWGKYCSRRCTDAARKSAFSGEKNPNYRGGKIKASCLRCGTDIEVKPAVLKRGGGKFCSRECTNADRRKNVQSVARSSEGAVRETP